MRRFRKFTELQEEREEADERLKQVKKGNWKWIVNSDKCHLRLLVASITK